MCLKIVPGYIIEQTLVIVGIFVSSISDGFIFGQMSGMLEALHNAEGSISLDNNDLSWIASTINITCFVGFALIGVVTEIFGRRKSVTIATIPVIISWIMTYKAHNKTVLILSRFLAGVSYGGILFMSYVNIGEYMSPNIRFMSFNMLVCVGSLVGTMFGHILSVVMDWRNVALVGLLPSLLSAAIPLFWVESPMWLAGKGRFEECEKSFRLLRTPGEAAEEELKLLISVEKDKRTKYKHMKNNLVALNMIKDAFKKRYFWKIILLSLLVNIYKVAAGRVLFSTLAITILQGITGTPDILLFTLTTNGFAVFGACMSCLLLRRFKMRQLLFPTAFLANICLILLGLVLYLKPDKDEVFNWIKILLLATYLVIVGAGPYPVLESILTEIFPLELKTFIIFTIGAIVGVIQFLAIKLAPDMFLVIGYHGVFFLNAFITFLCLVYLWFFLPETKGKTLQEIELYLKINNCYDSDNIKQEQMKELLNIKTMAVIVNE
ncbi:facilitated trehalose transporter Tret1-like [Pieris rapae]|uniref:facilitated trehalose transporter Tret1-like n=1 Tax=Pieris rapae TaxID=64459 RepID=UPI001E27E46D|nr:facilitated trehalose transporter Tret1-like [Pieris rapae]